MAVAADSLITLAEYKEYMAVSEGEKTFNDKQAESLINSCSKLIEGYCDRKFVDTGTAIDEIFTGNTSSTYYIRNRKFLDSATYAPVISYWDGINWVVMTTTLYPRRYTDDSGMVFLTDGNRFSLGDNSYKINHRYGWTQANIPTDLKLAACKMLKKTYLRIRKEGIKSESTGGGGSITYDIEPIGKDLEQILYKYRVVSF